jgi:ubiquinone/menaquinone biosynthesis C-methylase UbiE
MKTRDGTLQQYPPRPTALAWTILRAAIRAGDTVIDATAGNGHDTAFLAECVGPGGRVIAYDIQEEAIRSARQRVSSLGMDGRVEFHVASHAAMSDHAAGSSVSVIMFNLGYLPGGDHEVSTRAEETLRALDQATRLLKPGGILSVVCYPGHEEGAAEASMVEENLLSLASGGWRLAKYSLPGTLRPAPFLIMAGKPQ